MNDIILYQDRKFKNLYTLTLIGRRMLVDHIVLLIIVLLLLLVIIQNLW